MICFYCLFSYYAHYFGLGLLCTQMRVLLFSFIFQSFMTQFCRVSWSGLVCVLSYNHCFTVKHGNVSICSYWDIVHIILNRIGSITDPWGTLGWIFLVLWYTVVGFGSNNSVRKYLLAIVDNMHFKNWYSGPLCHN